MSNNKRKNDILFVISTLSIGIIASVVIVLFFPVAALMPVITGVLIAIIARFFKLKPTEAEKINVTCKNFSELYEIFNKKLPKFKQTSRLREGCNIFLFTRTKPLKMERFCYMLVDLREEVRYPDQLFAQNILLDMLGIHNGYSAFQIKVVLIICVEERDRWLDAMVNNNIYQSAKLVRLPIVISFLDEEMHMAKQKDGPGEYVYKKMRKEWLKLATDAGLVADGTQKDGSVCPPEN